MGFGLLGGQNKTFEYVNITLINCNEDFFAIL